MRPRSIGSRSLFALRFSCLRHPPRRSAPPFRVVGVACEKGRDRVARAPVKETRALRSEVRFPRCVLELSSFFRSRWLRRRDPKKRCRFTRRSFGSRSSPRPLRGAFEVLADLPRRAESSPACSSLRALSESKNHVSLLQVALKKGPQRRHLVLQHVSDARARPELPYLFRFSSGRAERLRARREPEKQRAGVPAVRPIMCDRKEPRPLRHRLRGPSRGLLAAFFPRFLGGKAVTSSNCKPAAQVDDGARSTRISPGPSRLGSIEQRGSKPPSEGPSHVRRSTARF